MQTCHLVFSLCGQRHPFPSSLSIFLYFTALWPFRRPCFQSIPLCKLIHALRKVNGRFRTACSPQEQLSGFWSGWDMLHHKSAASAFLSIPSESEYVRGRSRASRSCDELDHNFRFPLDTARSLCLRLISCRRAEPEFQDECWSSSRGRLREESTFNIAATALLSSNMQYTCIII